MTTWMVLGAPEAETQLRTLPVYPHAALQRGATVAVDYGRDLDSAVGVAQYVGGRATLQKGRASVEIGAGWRDAGTDPDFQAAISAGMRLLGDKGATIGVQLGVGYLRSGKGADTDHHLALPLTLGVAFPRLPAGAVVLRPWLAPSVQVNRVAFAQVIVNQPGVGGSAGVDLALPGRLGVHLAVQWSRFADRRTTGVTLPGVSQVTLGAGAHIALGARAARTG